MRTITNLKELIGEKNGFGLIITKPPKDNADFSSDAIVAPIVGNQDNFLLQFDYDEDANHICHLLNLMGFNITYEPIDLALLFKYNCKPWNFLSDDLNSCLSYNKTDDIWSIETFDFFIVGTVYIDFNFIGRDEYFQEEIPKKYLLEKRGIVKYLNKHKIQPEKVWEAFNSLGWFTTTEYTD